MPPRPLIIDQVPCDIAALYAALVQSVTLCLIYAPMYPPLYLITALIMLGTWASTKYACKWWYEKPPAIDEEMAEATRQVLERRILDPHPHPPSDPVPNPD